MPKTLQLTTETNVSGPANEQALIVGNEWGRVLLVLAVELTSTLTVKTLCR
jgi:hypothetical protein